MNEFTIQIILAIAMFVTTAIAGLAPLKVIKMIISDGVMSRRASVVMSIMSCYAGGVFLATCFLDTLPHVNENFRKFKKIASWKTPFPLPEFVICVGILLVYVLEEMFARLLSKSNKKNEFMRSETSPEKETEPLEVFQAVGRECSNGGNTNCEIEIPRNRNNSIIATSIIHSITFTVALSFHSILEGVALGVQDEKIGIITLFISLLLHKGIEAFSVGLQITRTITKQVKMIVATIIIYSLMTPIGSIFGLLLQSVDINEVWRQGIIVILEALAIGAFIFVTFLEVLSEQRNDPKAVTKELIAIAMGVFTISGFQYFEETYRATDLNDKFGSNL